MLNQHQPESNYQTSIEILGGKGLQGPFNSIFNIFFT
jgi:hypothetical protein